MQWWRERFRFIGAIQRSVQNSTDEVLSTRPISPVLKPSPIMFSRLSPMNLFIFGTFASHGSSTTKLQMSFGWTFCAMHLVVLLNRTSHCAPGHTRNAAFDNTFMRRV